ncbi:MAG: rRNA pseudouridine synthase [Bacillus sp. (in: Bacteria)]|nr:rRNA pseudouridine synthase [Bacillus sp. (in: firmicutes)]MCM1427877.1 rRNA pseudouridine synthase [Eubacterium sp.]
MDNKTTRLNKYIAQCGICSRRDADKLIEKGAVTVNGKPAHPGLQVTDADEVCVHGKPIKSPEKKVVLAYYKPIGVTCTQRDKHAKVKVTDNVRYPIRVTYAGRLDKDSEGLLLMTNDGELIDAMMRGANRHEKEYVVKVDKILTDDALEKMRAGIYLEELGLTTRACKITRTGEKTMNMILTQGVNRQIRRMCKAVGYRVCSLKRTRVMNVYLANLKPGEYRELSEEETQLLYSLCKITH